MRLISVTLGAAATPITTNTSIYASMIIVQDNATHSVRLGDNTVSATKGILLGLGGGSSTITLAFPRGAHLSEWYLFGTAADVIDVLYEQAT